MDTDSLRPVKKTVSWANHHGRPLVHSKTYEVSTPLVPLVLMKRPKRKQPVEDLATIMQRKFARSQKRNARYRAFYDAYPLDRNKVNYATFRALIRRVLKQSKFKANIRNLHK